MAQLVASASGVELGGVAEFVGSNLARVKIFTASIGSVDSLYPSVYIYIYERGSEKRVLKAFQQLLYNRRLKKKMPSIEKEPIYDGRHSSNYYIIDV